MKKFNVSNTLEAYQNAEGKFDTLDMLVHDELLQGKYLVKHCNHIRKQLAKLECVDGKVLVNQFSGRLMNMIPNPIGKDVISTWNDFSIEKARDIAASLITSILVDSGEYNFIREVVKSPDSTDYRPRFSTKLYLEFAGVTPVKSKLYGLETEPGMCYQHSIGPVTLAPKFIKLLRSLGSMAFKLSDVASAPLIKHGNSLSKDYNSHVSVGGVGESGVAKRRRIKADADFIMTHVAPLDKFYLPMKFDSRSRMYYYFQLLGMRPQGKLWETLMIDAHTPKLLDLSAIDHLKHIIYVVKYGRCSVEEAVEKFTDADMEWAEYVDPMLVSVELPYSEETKDLYSAAEDKFGELLLVNKVAKCIKQTIAREPTSYIFGKDLTNSGLMLAGASFKSSEMITSANLSSDLEVHDSHADMQESYNLTTLSRKAMKKISNPMFHGASPNSLVKNVQSALRKSGVDEHTANTIDLAHITALNHASFGKEVDNIHRIASWGAASVNNNRTKLFWTTSDGFKAYHRAHIESCPVEFNVATAQNESGFRAVNVVRDMPLLQLINGRALHEKGHVAKGSRKAVAVKKGGFYANITHSFDATLAREVVANVIEKDEVCLIKHDDYMQFADNFDDTIIIVNDYFKTVSEVNPYQKALESAHIAGMPPLPELLIGAGVVEDSVNMLMP